MKLRKPSHAILAAAVAVAICAAGCGSAVRRPGATASGSNVTNAGTPHIVQPGEANGRLDAVERHIEAGGHGVSPRTHDTYSIDSLAVDMRSGGETFVAGYRSSSDLALEMRQMERIERRFPDQIALRAVGTHLYWIAGERSLTAAQRAEFAQIVADGEGLR